jgi:hypothetical protein
MRKQMTARFAGRCALSGVPIRKGDWITYDTVTRKAYLTEHDDCQVSFNDYTNRRNYVSHVFNVGGQELYRNKAGRCIDAPCCGCCTV